MRNKKIIQIGILSIIIVIIAFQNLGAYLMPLNINKVWKNLSKSTLEKACLSFLDNKMSEKNYGIYTNYLDKQSQGDITQGHEVLSESEGLILLYSVEGNDKERFDHHFNIIKNKMLLKNNLIGWRLNKENVNETSAAIDDLRIVKALFLAYDRWDEFEYKKYGVKIGEAIKEHSTFNGYVVDFNDSKNKAHRTTISYLDLYAISLMAQLDSDWKVIQDNCQYILNRSYISDKLPLYKKYYDVDEETFSDEQDIETLYSMIIALYRTEMGYNVKTFVKWAKAKLNTDGAIYSKYNSNTGKASSNIESTAIYAVGAIIADNINDRDLYGEFIKLMVKYQVKDKSSKIYGGFGDSVKSEAFSFDNLQALLAFQRSISVTKKMKK